MTDRMLATVQEIAEIKPIDNADAIEAIRINGWWVVARKGEFRVGESVVFIEVDAFVPHNLAPFLSKGKEPREYQGIKGERLRTIKLRGQLSQGLVLPLTAVPESALWFEDLSEVLGIVKWERELSPQLRGMARGNFPTFIKKTDQERIQNIPKVLQDRESRYEVSLKLDGSSMTTWVRDDEVGVCSRNLDLKLDESNAGNSFVDMANRSGLLHALKRFHERFGRNIAVQGELMGPGIQGNRENLPAHELFVFDVWDIDEQRYMGAEERYNCLMYLPVKHVPLIHDEISLDDLGIGGVQDILDIASLTKSLNHPVAEGLVFKEVGGNHSFKAISDRFLLRESE